MITRTIDSYCIPSQSQSHKCKEFAKTLNFWILKKALHETHFLKLLDKVCKYWMDPASIMEDTERTRICLQTGRRTRWNQYTPFNFIEWGYDQADNLDIHSIHSWITFETGTMG